MARVRVLDSKGINDAHGYVRNNVRAGTIEQLKSAWRAHPDLKVTYSDEPVEIAPSAMDRYIEDAHKFTYRTGRERGLLYSCSRDGKVISVIEPKLVGDGISVDVMAQRLFDEMGPTEVLKELKVSGIPQDRAGYGHTHPIGFGPVFSLVSWGPQITPYGKDYSVAILNKNNRQEHLDAPYHLMGAPHMSLFGVVEALENGRIVYHPWKIEEGIDLKKVFDELTMQSLASQARRRVRVR